MKFFVTLKSLLFNQSSKTNKVKSDPSVIVLPDSNKISSKSFLQMQKYFEEKSIVQLGEGIHMTHEFPIYRKALAQSLFENLGFDIILFEGSMVEAWLASDHLLKKGIHNSTDNANYRDIAFFPLWRSEEYDSLFKSPFYVASYDCKLAWVGFVMKQFMNSC